MKKIKDFRRFTPSVAGCFLSFRQFSFGSLNNLIFLYSVFSHFVFQHLFSPGCISCLPPGQQDGFITQKRGSICSYLILILLIQNKSIFHIRATENSLRTLNYEEQTFLSLNIRLHGPF